MERDGGSDWGVLVIVRCFEQRADGIYGWKEAAGRTSAAERLYRSMLWSMERQNSSVSNPVYSSFRNQIQLQSSNNLSYRVICLNLLVSLQRGALRQVPANSQCCDYAKVDILVRPRDIVRLSMPYFNRHFSRSVSFLASSPHVHDTNAQ